MRLFHTLFCIIMLVAVTNLAHGDLPPEVLARCKHATAFVEVEVPDGMVSGSAFCIDSAGYFVTNNHVVEEWKPGKRLLLVLDPGDKTEKKLPATIVRQDRNGDLALLHVTPPGGLAALPLGDSDALTETLEVVAFGYPFGKELAVDANSYPSVSVSSGRITALRKAGGALELIQLDASINHGNSGGPLVDTHGRVVGIIVAKIEDANSVNFAIPVNRLSAMLNRPEITLLSPAAVAASRQHQEQDFTIGVSVFRNAGADKSVELILQGEDGTPRTFAGVSADGHTFHARAIPSPVAGAPALLQIVAASGEDRVVCHLKDRNLLINGKSVMLSQIDKIERADRTTVTLLDGAVIVGDVPALSSVEVLLGGIPSTLNLSKADSITISHEGARMSIIDYRIVVRQAGRVVGDRVGSLPVVEGAISADPAELQRLVAVARTVDVVEPGDERSESDHKLVGDDIATGVHLGRKWRAATRGGWFAYTVKVAAKPQQLICTYWGSDVGDRTFDILVDGVTIATQTLNNNRPGEFYDEVYPIPMAVTRGKNQITVRFQAHPGSGAGGLFGFRITKRPGLGEAH